MPNAVKTLARPFLVRPGARYRCFGDGLCCHDIHGLGALTRKEAADVRRIDRRGARYSEDFEEVMLHTAADGGCHFLLPDLRCGIHAEHGPERKPGGCRTFPLGLTATPDGGRVTTEHRCPCRTLGERPEITPEAAEGSICDASGRPDIDRRVAEVRLEKGRRAVPFARWLEVERELLARLERGEAPAEVLGAKPFPKLRDGRWTKEAEELVEAKDGSRFGYAIAWFGDTILHLVSASRPRPPGRPWAPSFDRAEARSPRARTSREVFADWVADVIWGLKWADDRSFALVRVELATRLAIAESIAARLVREGVRPDRAAAEAVMVVEIVGESEYWDTIVRRMVA